MFVKWPSWACLNQSDIDGTKSQPVGLFTSLIFSHFDSNNLIELTFVLPLLAHCGLFAPAWHLFIFLFFRLPDLFPGRLGAAIPSL